MITPPSDAQAVAFNRKVIDELIGPLLHYVEEDGDFIEIVQTFVDNEDDTSKIVGALASIVVMNMVTTSIVMYGDLYSYYHMVLENYDRALAEYN